MQPLFGKPPDDTELPPQLRQDTCDAFNALKREGKIPEDMGYAFEKNEKGKVVVHLWRERFSHWVDNVAYMEAYQHFYTDPKELIAGAGKLSIIRGID